MHNLEVQQNALKKEMEVIKEEANKEEIEGLSRCVQIYQINSNEASAEEMLSWMRSVRVFKSKDRKSEHSERWNTLNMIVS